MWSEECEEKLRQELSILIPTFNDNCYECVKELARQANDINGLQWEVIVADDGSTDQAVIDANSAIERMRHCRVLRQPQNIGRAAIRNFLARSAQYEYLLFIDGDMTIVRKDFLLRYLQSASTPVYGGYEVGADQTSGQFEACLRYLYEKAVEPQHDVLSRQQQPNRDFHTSNFMAERRLMLYFPFDERFRQYGYEDVFWGRQLADASVTIYHLDNPVAFNNFEDNAVFVKKTETALQTLHQFATELQGYSRLLSVAQTLRHYCLAAPCRLLFRFLGKRLRQNLCGPSPSLRIFHLYRLLYLISLG